MEWYGATEVAKSLSYLNPHKAILDHCKKEGVTIREVGVVTGKKADTIDEYLLSKTRPSLDDRTK